MRNKKIRLNLAEAVHITFLRNIAKYTVTEISLDRFSLGNHIANRLRFILVTVYIFLLAQAQKRIIHPAHPISKSFLIPYDTCPACSPLSTEGTDFLVLFSVDDCRVG